MVLKRERNGFLNGGSVKGKARGVKFFFMTVKPK